MRARRDADADADLPCMRRQISLGDARSYYLSTARNDLGVIFANSEAGGWSLVLLHRKDAQGADATLLHPGAPLKPLSWQGR